MSKVTLVGASSMLWSPKLLGDFYVTPEQPIDEICLTARTRERLEPIAALTKLMEQKTGRTFRVTVETDLERAVKGADFVVIAISVGGLKAMEKDLVIPAKYGILPTVGDTVGPSGYSRLLRNVPVFLDMAKRVEKVAPEAWVLNVANPLTPLTELIGTHTSLKTVGLCCGIENHIWILKDLLGFDEFSDVDFRIGGVDHCSWFLDIKVKGQDLYPELRRMSVADLEKKASLLYSGDEWAKLDSLTAGFTLFKLLGHLPAISDRHLGEFFPFFVTSEENLKEYNMKRTHISHRLGWGENARKTLNAVLEGKEELSLAKSRDIVVDIINALAGAGEITTTVNYRNKGQIENMPKDVVVETVARIDTDKITPVDGTLPPQLVPIVQPHVLRQRLALRAAVEGSRGLFVAALLADPQVQQLDTVETMADELLRANKELLPQFDL